MYGANAWASVPYASLGGAAIVIAACINVEQNILFHANVKIAPLFYATVTQNKC